MQNKTQKQDIRTLTEEQLSGFFKSIGSEPFKGRQVWEWLWKKYILDFDKMTNLSVSERNLLTATFSIKPAKISDTMISCDNTIKAIFTLYDNQMVEGVLIPDNGRVTACISSQVGCIHGCRFCATAKMGFKRNMTCPEIFDQVLLLRDLSNEQYQTGLTNIVFMGMGEPLSNYDNVTRAIDMVTHKNALALSPSRITLSTAGITDGIIKLAKKKVKFNLAVSLHTADNKKRNLLMPVNRKNNLNDLADSLKLFHRATNNRITIEYLLIDNFNDSLSDARLLAKYCKNFPVKINIIEYNKVKNAIFQRPSEEKTKKFIEALNKYNLIVNVRKSKGNDINAACGQLAIKAGSH